MSKKKKPAARRGPTPKPTYGKLVQCRFKNKKQEAAFLALTAEQRVALALKGAGQC